MGRDGPPAKARNAYSAFHQKSAEKRTERYTKMERLAAIPHRTLSKRRAACPTISSLTSIRASESSPVPRRDRGIAEQPPLARSRADQHEIQTPCHAHQAAPERAPAPRDPSDTSGDTLPVVSRQYLGISISYKVIVVVMGGLEPPTCGL